MKGTQYYAERLLAQAISDPRVNALDGESVRDYIKEEAEKLCVPPEETAAHAMRGYEALATGDFKKGTHFRRGQVEPRSAESEDISTSPPF